MKYATAAAATAAAGSLWISGSRLSTGATAFVPPIRQHRPLRSRQRQQPTSPQRNVYTSKGTNSLNHRYNTLHYYQPDGYPTDWDRRKNGHHNHHESPPPQAPHNHHNHDNIFDLHEETTMEDLSRQWHHHHQEHRQPSYHNGHAQNRHHPPPQPPRHRHPHPHNNHNGDGHDEPPAVTPDVIALRTADPLIKNWKRPNPHQASQSHLPPPSTPAGPDPWAEYMTTSEPQFVNNPEELTIKLDQTAPPQPPPPSNEDLASVAAYLQYTLQDVVAATPHEFGAYMSISDGYEGEDEHHHNVIDVDIEPPPPEEAHPHLHHPLPEAPPVVNGRPVPDHHRRRNHPPDHMDHAHPHSSRNGHHQPLEPPPPPPPHEIAEPLMPHRPSFAEEQAPSPHDQDNNYEGNAAYDKEEEEQELLAMENLADAWAQMTQEGIDPNNHHPAYPPAAPQVDVVGPMEDDTDEEQDGVSINDNDKRYFYHEPPPPPMTEEEEEEAVYQQQREEDEATAFYEGLSPPSTNMPHFADAVVPPHPPFASLIEDEPIGMEPEPSNDSPPSISATQILGPTMDELAEAWARMTRDHVPEDGPPTLEELAESWARMKLEKEEEREHVVAAAVEAVTVAEASRNFERKPPVTRPPPTISLQDLGDLWTERTRKGPPTGSTSYLDGRAGFATSPAYFAESTQGVSSASNNYSPRPFSTSAHEIYQEEGPPPPNPWSTDNPSTAFGNGNEYFHEHGNSVVTERPSPAERQLEELVAAWAARTDLSASANHEIIDADRIGRRPYQRHRNGEYREDSRRPMAPDSPL